MNNKDYFAHLYDIASHLNKEYSLHSALSKSLEKTAEILDLETGWIWLTEPDNKSVYLAVSHNLPPALSNYPERLSGWCYCIKQYLSDDMEEAVNISEIACSRLKDINSGTNDLRFHATIPIIIEGQKVGLINLLSRESRKLNEQQLTILNTIGELVGTCIQRARLQTSFGRKEINPKSDLGRVSEGVILPKLESIITSLQSGMGDSLKVKAALQELIHLQKDLNQLLFESNTLKDNKNPSNAFSYPKNPITKRELQVLTLIKDGLTNEAIGNRLHITERTVKFHITSILSKLNAKNRTEAIDIALKRGLFSV
ncbi:LuxR C-terminal-related transcriptional regulator [Flagellimonas meridianipacifica]|uniref:GAF domain-containing protein n=1 Tax=Flagellimonas meridianipacifica TaxID=1080225 RepID=A0A2T0MFW5_9FLAO|nr:LuxR C-terminal-related transcriptional regulator [Allomuricauda pacifica]PRX56470.1 GAF domain-containing protein [Allomuricauda pacifica]